MYDSFVIIFKIYKIYSFVINDISLIISYFDNQTENFVTTKTYQQVSKINNLKYDNDSRTDIFKESLNTVNQVKDNIFRTSIYSSISNSRYNQFYYDIINNPISIRNRVACLSNSNIFFQGLMAVKQYIVKRSFLSVIKK